MSSFSCHINALTGLINELARQLTSGLIDTESIKRVPKGLRIDMLQVMAALISCSKLGILC